MTWGPNRTVIAPAASRAAVSSGLIPPSGPTTTASTSGAAPGSARFDEAVARHAGGLWAAKEAFVKAWSCALFGSAPLIGPDEVDWREIEVIHDEWNRPSLALHGRVASACADSLGEPSTWRVLVSISHDAGTAVAQVIIADATG